MPAGHEIVLTSGLPHEAGTMPERVSLKYWSSGTVVGVNWSSVDIAFLLRGELGLHALHSPSADAMLRCDFVQTLVALH